MFLGGEAKKEFDIQPLSFPGTESTLSACIRAYQGHPTWLDSEDDITTINFAKSVCVEVARLTTLGISIKVDGSARADWLQEQVEQLYFSLRPWAEYGDAYGTIILKPNGEFVDLYTPEEFAVVDTSAGKITGAVFRSREISGDGKRFFTRMEYHHFDDDGIYHIDNRCYVSEDANSKGKPIGIKETPWASLEEESSIVGLDKPLFGVWKTPHANHKDVNSPLSLPIFVDALKELEDLDIAYSRNASEIFESRRTVLLDSDKLMATGEKVTNTLSGFESARKQLRLPDYVKNVYGNGSESFYQEINPTLNTDTRLTGLNALLSQIGYKCGFSNGYFVFNERTGVATATQVEADQQRTIQLIKDCRDQLESCMNDLLYALDKMADLYDLAPAGAWEVNFDFGDITYNLEEDRARWLSYANAQKVPFWYYLVKFEGFTEEEAKALVQEAQPEDPTLFGEEE